MKIFRFIFLLFLVYGCAAYTPKQVMERDIKNIENSFQLKEDDRFYFLVNSALSDVVAYGKVGTEPANDLKQYLGSPARLDRYRQLISMRIDSIKTISDYDSILGNNSNLEKLALISSGEKQSNIEKAQKVVFEDNLAVSSKLNITYTDKISDEGFLKDAVSQNMILIRSVNVIKENADSFSVDGFVNLAKKTAQIKNTNIAQYDEISKILLSSVKNLTLARALDPYYPGLLSSFDKRTQLKVAVDAKGMDRIATIDLMGLLKTNIPQVDWVEQSIKSNNRIFPELVIERARWAEADLPNRGKTITLDRTSVDFTHALFSMPELSTYNYEIQESGFSIDYGFLISYSDSASGLPVEKVVRGLAESKSTVCVNQRVINAFGGAREADFIANDQMRSSCGNKGLSKDEVRAAILSELKNEVSSLEKINKTVILRQ